MVDALNETFDDDLGFSKSAPFFVAGVGLEYAGIYDPSGAASDFDGALIAPDATFLSGYSGFTGPFLVFQSADPLAIPAETTLTWSAIDVTGLRDVSFSGLFASIPDVAAGPDAGDYIIVEVSVDGGAFQTLLDFRADGADGEFLLDTDNDGVGDGVALTGAAQLFSAGIVTTGATTVDLRLRSFLDDVHEDFAVDDFKVTGSVNAGPVANADAISANENTGATGNVLADNGAGVDADADGDALTVTAVNGAAGNVGSQITLGSGALLTVGANGAFSYDTNGQFETLAAGQTTTDSFTYEISDGFGGSDTATVTFTINGVNDAPVARNDALSVGEGAVLNGDVFVNNGAGVDSDVDAGAAFTVSKVNGAAANVGGQITLTSGALLTVNGDGTFAYDQNGQFESLAVGSSATETFTYEIDDGQGGVDTATVTITINGVNDGPVARNDAFAGNEDNTITGNVFANNGSGADSDIDFGDTLTVSKVNGLAVNVGSPITLGSGAVLTVGANGAVSFNPSASYESLGQGASATETFTYEIADGNGGTDTATATITINGVNDNPDARNDAVSTSKNAVLNGDLFANNGSGVDGDVDTGDVISVSAVNGQGVNVGSQITLSSGALLTVNADGTFSYDPNGAFLSLGAGATDTDSFTYTISDGKGGQDTATATVTIGGENNPPDARDDAFTVAENGSRSGNVLADNGAGADSDPNAGDTLTVTAVNGAPGNVGVSFTLTSGALVTVNPNGSMTYNPNGAFESLGVGATDTDSFTYTISDGNGGTDTATATFTITGANDAPIARNDAFSVNENANRSGNLLANNGSGADSDIDVGDVLTISKVNGAAANVGSQITLASGARLTVNPDGTFTYATNGQFESLGVGASDTDSFTYEVSDGNGGTDTATATITINGVNDAPIARNDAFSVNENASRSGNLLNANGSGADSDIDAGDVLSISKINGVAGNIGSQVTLSSGAAVTVNADGTFTYNTNGAFESLGQGATTTDSFTYEVSDGNGGADTATATFTITGVNDAPDARNDSISVNENANRNGNLLSNNGSGADRDIDVGDVLTVTKVNGAAANVGSQITLGSGALLTVNADGTFTFATNGQFESLGVGASDTETFTYEISDGKGGTDTATATVTINGVNDAPIARNDAFSLNENISRSGNLLNANGSGADSDIDNGDVLSISKVNGQAGGVGSAVTLASGARVTVNADGTFTYNTNGAFESLGVGASTTDSFTYEVSDGNGGTDTATATFTISGVNDAPDARNDAFSVNENADRSGNLFAANGSGADRDVDAGDSFIVTKVNGNLTSVGSPITLASGAVLTVSVDGAFTYETNGQFESLGAGATDTETFTYEISDGNGGTDTATTTITITGVNDAPIARNDAFTNNENAIITGDIFVNNGSGADSDIDIGDILSVDRINGATGVGSQITLASGALLTLNADGSFTYNTNGQFDSLGVGASDTDSFTYRINDGEGGVSTGTVTITLTGVNDGPDARNDAVSVSEDAAGGGDLFANNGSGADRDIDIGDVITLSQVNGSGANVGSQITLASGALLTVNADGSYSYDANGRFESLGVGSMAFESFTYQISDGKGGTDTATATVTIIGVNDAPIARSDAASLNEDSSQSGNVFANNGSGADSDIDFGDVLRVAQINEDSGGVGNQITLASGALLTLGADGSYTYDANGQFESLGQGASTTDSFGYTLSDGQGGFDAATVTFTIFGVNDAPIARNDAVSINEDSILNGNVFSSNGAGADSDVDIGDIIRVSEVNGAVGDVGSELTVSDGALLTLNTDGVFRYDPNGQFESLGAGASTTRTFTYQISDGKGGFDLATATVTILGVNDAPIARNDAVSVNEDSDISAGLFADNGSGADSDIDIGDILRIADVNGVAASVGQTIALSSGALLTVGADGAFTYNANGQFEFLGAGAQTTDTFNYRVGDGQGGSDVAQATVTITGVNDAPIARNDSFATLERNAVGGDLFVDNGAGADSDVDIGDVLRITEINGAAVNLGSTITLASGALLTVNADGSANYDPNGAFEYLIGGALATDGYAYTLSDGMGGFVEASVNIQITGELGGLFAGTADADTILATVFADTVTGFDGDDDLNGNGGADVIEAGLGHDRVLGGDGSDTLMGQADNDTLIGGLGADSKVGGVGDDTFQLEASTGGDDTLIGGDGYDSVSRVFGFAANAVVNDSLYTENGAGESISLSGIEQFNILSGDNADIFDFTGFGGLISIGSGAGDDMIQGARLGDTILSGLGDDVLFGHDGDDRLESGDGADEVRGGDGADSVLGGAGDDTLMGGLGADMIDGGEGFDEVSYGDATSGVLVDLAIGATDGDFAVGDVLLNIERVFGSEFGDVLTGSGAGEQLKGAGGDDMINGGMGANIIDGGAGFDTASYADAGSGVVINLGTSSGANDVAEGDLLLSIEGVIGSIFDDSLTGNHASNYIEGGVGADTLSGGAGADTLDGGDGSDLLSYESATGGVSVDLLAGVGASNHAAGDQIFNIEHLTASSFNDTLKGDAFGNVFKGAGGNDVLEGGAGGDFLNGGDGFDAAAYRNSSTAVHIDLGASLYTGGEADGDILVNIEDIVATDFNDTLTGSSVTNVLVGRSGNDVLAGLAGDDSLFGDAGNDTIYGDAGADFIDGGAGIDILLFTDAAAGVAANLASGVGTGGVANGDRYANIEDIDGSNFSDSFIGTSIANIIDGRNGHDTISGDGGDDTLFGRDGDDVIKGGGGADFIEGGLGADDLFGEDGADELIGGDGDDTIDGGSGQDLITGGDGVDIMNGNIGNDTVIGGRGADIVAGGDGNDSLTGGDGFDQLFGGLDSDTLEGGAGNDTLSGSGGADRLFGGDGADSLLGDEGTDFVDGGAGNDTVIGNFGVDTIMGGLGNDLLLGGGDADTFIFEKGHGIDQISDFEAGAGSSETLSIRGFGSQIDSFNELMAVAFDDAFGNVVIDFGAGDTIQLLGLSKSDLTDDDFTFG